MKRFLAIFCLLGGFLLGGYHIFQWFLESQRYESTDNAYLKTNAVLIAPKVSGYVQQLFFVDNEFVRKNDILAFIDNRDYQARLAQIQAKVLEEQAHLQRLQAGKNTQQAHIVSADATVSAIEAKRQQINQDLHRFNALIERGSAPKQTLDKIQAESKQAAAELRGSQAAVSAQQKQLTTFDSEMLETQARIKQAQAQVELAKIDLENTQIRAPFDGFIAHRGIQIGSFVQTGMTLAHLFESQKIWVEANFKETQLQNMKVGQPVIIHVDAYSGLILKGKIDSFAPASGSEFSLLPPENATGNFTKVVRRVPVKITLDENQNLILLRAGLSVVVKVQVKDV